MGSGGGSGNTVTTTVPQEFKPFFTDLFGGARRAAELSAGSTQGFSGPSYGFAPQGGYQSFFFPSGGFNVPLGASFSQQNPRPPSPYAPFGNSPARLGGAGNNAGILGPQGNFAQGFQRQPQSQVGSEFYIDPATGQYRRTSNLVNPSDAIVGAPFPGPFSAPANPLEYFGLSQKAQLGMDLQGLGSPLLDLGYLTASGAFLNPESNPGLQGAINAATRPVYQTFNEVTRPNLSSQALQSGAYRGSSRRELLEQNAARDLQNTVGDITSSMVFDNYARERALQQQAGTLLDQAASLQQLPPELLLQTGAGFRGLDQIGIEERIRQFEEGLAAPFRPLFPLASIIQGGNIGSSTVSSGQPSGGLGGGILGALGGAAAGAGAANALDLSGGYGYGLSGLTALLGGLAGGLG